MKRNAERTMPMVALIALAAIATLTVVESVSVTPVEKVITLLEDLKLSVEEEASKEAESYDKFACFCKDGTDDKSTAIMEGQDSIDKLTAEIGEKTAQSSEAADEKDERIAKKEKLMRELEVTKVRCAKALAEYEASAAELTKAILALEKAIKALEDAKPSAALLEVVQRDLRLAEVLNIVDGTKKQAVAALLQQTLSVDPDDPEYKYHSQSVIDVLEKLKTQYSDKKAELDAEWEKESKACEDLKTKLSSQIEEEGKAIDQLTEKIATLEKEIAEARETLILTEKTLKEDQLYLGDLTKQCEERAGDWDQRSKMRAEEVDAISKALEILKEKVLPKEGERALFVQAHARTTVPELTKQTVGAVSPSFLQVDVPRTRGRSLLERARGSFTTYEVKKAQALAALASEGKRLHSTMLSTLVAKLSADPFAKVKTLIQNLIEKLLKEAASEASKKGFCDTELGKAEQDRDFRLSDVKKLNAEIGGLKARKLELDEEIEMLGDKLSQLSEDLGKATKMRAEQKAENEETIKKATEGLAALEEAIVILKDFYKQAAKGKVLLQASPVDEDTEGAGFTGAYKGKQDSARNVIGLLEVIKSDFERTLKKTEAAEKQAAADFVEFERASKTDQAGKSTTKELDEQELVNVKNSLEEKTDDLQTSMDLLDSALKELEELKPVCIDTAMSYEERVKQREKEMDALKKALCILDTEGVEPDC